MQIPCTRQYLETEEAKAINDADNYVEKTFLPGGGAEVSVLQVCPHRHQPPVDA